MEAGPASAGNLEAAVALSQRDTSVKSVLETDLGEVNEGSRSL